MIFRARNEETNIQHFLDHHKDMYDCFVALIDRSSDGTYGIVKKDAKCAAVFEKIHDIGYSHQKDHSVLEHICQFFPHKWIWRLDIDERVCHTFMDEMKNVPEGVVNIGMRFLSLFPDDRHFISGNHTYAKIQPITRLFRRIERDGIPTRNDAPVYISNSLVYHYNMISPMRREHRYATYVKYNPESLKDVQRGYGHIVDVEKIRYLPHGNCQTLSELCSYLLSMSNITITEKKDISNIVKTVVNRWIY